MEQTTGRELAPAAVYEMDGARRTGLTVEHGLYLVILLVAFGLRFINLGVAPLQPLEAAQAWPAWLAATGTQVTGSPAATSALFYGLQSVLFFVTGANEVLARLLPALVGTAVVLLPWWWRDWIGRGGALAVALLLAVDPWLVVLARTADAVGVTIFLGLLVLTALWRWQRADVAQNRGRSLGWERVLAVGLGLLLVSGPQAWSWLPVLLAFGWIFVFRRGFVRPQRASFIWFGVALVLGASGLLARLDAVAAVGTSLTAWLAQWSGDFGAGSDLYGLDSGWPWLRLLIDQPFLTVFGLVGLVLLATGRGLPPALWPGAAGGAGDAVGGAGGSAVGGVAGGAGGGVAGGAPGGSAGGVDPAAEAKRGARRLALFLGLWLAWGVVLVLLPGRSPFVLPMVGLPLAAAAGTALAYLLALPSGDVNGLEVAVLLGVATVLVIAGSVWLAMVVESFSYDTRLVLTAAMLIGLLVLIWAVFGFWAGWQAAAKLAGLFFAAMLLLVSVRSGWMLSHLGGQMTPNGLFPVTTLPEARLLPLDVQRISSLRNNDPYEGPLQVVTAGRPPDPLVGWLLRDMRRLAWVTAPDPQANTPLGDSSQIPTTNTTPMIVAPYGLEQDPGLGGLIGAKYPLTVRWLPAQLPALPEADATQQGLPAEELAKLRADQAWGQSTRPRLEWLLYRTVKDAPPVDGVALWATP